MLTQQVYNLSGLDRVKERVVFAKTWIFTLRMAQRSPLVMVVGEFAFFCSLCKHLFRLSHYIDLFIVRLNPVLNFKHVTKTLVILVTIVVLVKRHVLKIMEMLTMVVALDLRHA